MDKSPVISAVIYGRVAPDKEQSDKIREYLSKKYGAETELAFKYDGSIARGFRLEAEGGPISGKEVYDRTREGMFSRLQRELEEMDFSRGDVVSMVKCAIDDFDKGVISEEVGYVVSVGDGIAGVSGLEGAAYGEILVFSSGVKGMVLDLKKDRIGCVLFGDDEDIVEGSKVVRTGKCAGVPVGEEFLSRVIDPLGSPVDGKGKITAKGYLPVENPAPGIIDRQP